MDAACVFLASRFNPRFSLPACKKPKVGHIWMCTIGAEFRIFQLRTRGGNPMSAIVHLDVDAFFASVEQRDDPGLRGRPVAVGSGVVASCSYESRRYGVRTGMRLAEAKYLCHDLIILPGSYPRYEQAARHILAICEEQAPTIEVSALDDLYLDLTGLREGPDLEPLSQTLRTMVRDEVQLSVSLGSGTNKMIARIATNEAKPGGHRHVPAGSERDYIAPQPIRVLPGVGGTLEERFERLNLRQVRELAGVPVDLLRRLFGPNRGRTLHDQALGIDPRPVLPRKPQQSVGRRASFDPPVAELPFLSAMLSYLIDRACSWLRFHHLATRGLTLTIRYSDFESAQGRELFRDPTADEARLKEAAHERMPNLYNRRLPLRFLGVELGPLVAPPQEPTLFSTVDDEKQQRLLAAKDAVRQRFGFTSLLQASALEMSSRLDRDRENFQMRTPCLSR